MIGSARRRWLLLLGLVLIATGGAGCPFDPKIPSAQVLCFKPADCPSGYTCESIDSVGHPGLAVCCKQKGCAAGLPDAAVQQLENALKDAGADLAAEAGGPNCGNGRLDPGETCDPIASCPTSCPQVGCETYELHGSAAACTAACVLKGTQTACTSGDHCCPSGCAAAQDSDCSCTCGNGSVESACGETCDPIASCPVSCAPVGCMLRRVANSGTCLAQCVNDQLQTACLNGDGCCPPTCNAGNDNDCQARCGDGIVGAGEKCDGNCPTTCPTIGCQNRRLQGSAAACTAECVNDTVITSCTNGDGCCGSGCTTANDNDCACQCGNGLTEVACSESCDGANCPASCPAVGCQQRTLQGSAAACTAKCVNATLVATCTNGDGCCPPTCNANNDNNCSPVCGNSVLESGEKCDPPSACQTQSDACVNDNNNVRVRSGVVASCTFSCGTTARACGATADSFCPSACVPCAGSCATGQDIDCKYGNGTACVNGTQCSSGNCVDGVCCNSACSGNCDSCSTGTCTVNAAGAAGSPSCAPYVCNGSSASCPSSCSDSQVCSAGNSCQIGVCACQPGCPTFCHTGDNISNGCGGFCPHNCNGCCNTPTECLDTACP